ncbi:hypothetical protein ASR50_27245 [Streptomyces sp. 4F]|nr:hypothetical protein ASR50_27245 [Streptomyces sp. 4F]
MSGGNWGGCARCWAREDAGGGERARAAEHGAQFGARQRVGTGGGDGARGEGQAGRRYRGQDADEHHEQDPVALAPGRPRADAVA